MKFHLYVARNSENAVPRRLGCLKICVLIRTVQHPVVIDVEKNIK